MSDTQFLGLPIKTAGKWEMLAAKALGQRVDAEGWVFYIWKQRVYVANDPTA